MSIWAKSLRPVCASEAMTSLYPALADDTAEVAALASTAWGRQVDGSELSALGPALQGLSEGERYEVTCLAVLSAAEFVIQ